MCVVLEGYTHEHNKDKKSKLYENKKAHDVASFHRVIVEFCEHFVNMNIVKITF